VTNLWLPVGVPSMLSVSGLGFQGFRRSRNYHNLQQNVSFSI